MIKKGTALFFILLANIILLAHAVVPHHHHKSEACIVNSNCKSYSNVHIHSAIESKHEHDDDNDKEYCILKEVVVLPSNRIIKEYKSLLSSDNNLKLDGLQAILPNYKLVLIIKKLSSNTHTPLIPSSYVHYVNISLGLRAPPAV